MKKRSIFLVLTLGLATLAVAQGAQASADDDSVLRLDILFTADIHGYVDRFPAVWMNPTFPPPMGGAASATTYIKRVLAEVEAEAGTEPLLLDAGDCWQGSPVGTLTEGKVVTEYYNALDFDVVAMGNHEFDKGWENAAEFSRSLDHLMVSCNTMQEGTEDLVDWVVPYRIFERGGLRIGIIGAITTGTANMAFEENIRGIEFVPIAPQARKYHRILTDEKGCDLVILVVHEGLPHPSNFDEEWEEVQEEAKTDPEFFENAASGLELAHCLPEIPVMFGGHTHQGYNEPWVDPYTHVTFFEPYARGTAVGRVTLEIDRATGTVVGYETPERDRTLITLFEDQYWPDPEMDAILNPYVENVEAQLAEVVGRSQNTLNRQGRSNNPMGNFVSECMRAAFDADVAFTNTGGLRTDFAAGEISLRDLQELLPFGNTLVVLSMPGSMLLDIFDQKASSGSNGIYQSGAKVVADPKAPQGRRILECEIGGVPIDSDRIYRVITSDYLLEGNSGYNMLPTLDEDDIEFTEIVTRDAVARYLRQNSPVRFVADERYREKKGGARASYLQESSPN
jgi:5'-nucleotidase / UDP-sugar diphosphatase